MGRKRAQNGKWVQLTDREISTLIRYLDPNPESGKQWSDAEYVNEQSHETTVVICASFLFLVLGFLGFLWLYYR